MPLTRSAIEAEMKRINRELMRDLLAGGGKKVTEIEAEAKALADYVEKNKDKIID